MTDWLESGVDPDEFQYEVCDKCDSDMVDPEMTSESEVLERDHIATWVDIEYPEGYAESVPGSKEREGWDIVAITWFTVCPECGHRHSTTFYGSKHREKGIWLEEQTSEEMFAAVESPDYNKRVIPVEEDKDLPF